VNLRSARKIFLRSPATFRPMLRWQWNDPLNPDHLAAQMDQLLDNGMGGALIRPGAGLPPSAYLGEDWFESLTAVARRARKRRASLWIAEDLTDPTTQHVIAGILRDTPEYAAQMLSMDDLAPGVAAPTAGIVAAFEVLRESPRDDGSQPLEVRLLADTAIAPALSARRLVFRQASLPGQIRVFEPGATRELLKRTHQCYHENVRKYFGNTIGLCLLLGVGVPQVPGEAPWDSELPALFHETHGYSLVPNLPALFFDLPGCEAVRADFWALIDEMLREGFDAPFARWSAEFGIPHACTIPEAGNLRQAVAQTGRAMARHAMHSFAALSTARADCGAPYDRMACAEARSVKRQLGLEGVLEIASAGSPAMRRLAQGINFLSARSVSSIPRGDAKHEGGVPTLAETDAEARYAWMLGQGRSTAPVLLLHPYASLQASYRAGHSAPSALHDAIAGHFESIMRTLQQACIDFDLGDEALLEKHGTALQRSLRVGHAEYRAVVLPPLLNIRSSTLELLHDLAIGGGLVIAVGSLPELVDGRGSDRARRFFEEYGEPIVQGVDFGRYRALVERLIRAKAETRLHADSAEAASDRVLFQRSVWDQIEVLGLHNAGDALARLTLSYPATFTGRVESWDPLTGAIRELGPATEGQPLAQALTLNPGASTLIVTVPD